MRNCNWLGDQPQSWEFDVIAANAPIPEELRLDVLGSRKQIVFVEGKASSLDKPLYSLLFPSATIVSRNSSREVRQAVQGLRANQDTHHTIAFGIIDNDGLRSRHKVTTPPQKIIMCDFNGLNFQVRSVIL